MQQQKAGSATRILNKLKETHKKAVSLRGWARFASFIGLISISWMTFVCVEHFFFLPSYLKITAILLLFVIPPLAYKYVRIRRIGSFKDFSSEWAKNNNYWYVLDYLDLSNEESIGTAKIAIAQLEKRIDTEAVLENIESWYEQLALVGKSKQRITWTSVILLASLSLTLFIFYPSSIRLLYFWENSTRPNPYSYVITPTNLDVEEGTSIKFSITFTSTKTPFDLQLWSKNEQNIDYRPLRLNKMKSSSYQSDELTIFNDMQVFFTMDGFNSDTLTIKTQFKPSFDSLIVHIQPPSYLKQEKRSYKYPFERITYPENAKLYLSAYTSKGLDSMEVKVNGVSAISKLNFTVLNREALNAFLSIGRSQQNVDSLEFFLLSKNGLSLSDSYPFLLEKRLDTPPEVRWLYPEPNTPLKTNDALELSYLAKDDYGLRSVTLVYKLLSGFGTIKQSGTKQLSFPIQNDIGLELFKQIESWSLAPQDELQLVLIAKDNDAPNGYKSSSSDTLKLQVPSLLTELNDLIEDEASFDESFKEVDALQKERESRSQKMKEGLKESPEQAWRQQRNIQEQLENQQELSEKIKSLNEEFDKLKNEMKDSDLLSPETMKAYDEYKKLLEELQDEDLKKALEQMQKSLENMNPEQFRKSLENLEFNEDVYKERLERTIELFKKLKKEANLEQLDKALEKLAIQQDSLAAQEKLDEQMQQDVRDALNKLQKSIENLPKDAPKKLEESLKELSDELNKENDALKQEMDELLEQNEQEKSDSEGGKNQENREQQKQKQQDLSKKMKKMQQMVASQKSAMSKKQMNINIAALKSILKSLILSSEYQELVNERTKEMIDRSQGFIGQARKQKALNTYYSSISDSLFAVAKEVPELSNEILKLKERTSLNLEKALKEQTERSQNSAVFLERESLSGINELGQLVADVLEQLQNQMNGEGDGGGGSMNSQQMLEQMQQMNGQQQQINQQIQQMINDMAGERLSVEQSERLEQLSKQQNAIRKQLEDLQKNGAIPAGDRLQSELSRLQDEMEDAIRDLRGGNLDELFTKRQQNILSRMLEAEKSWQERGEEDKREAQTALEQLRGEDPTVTLEQIQQLIENQLNSTQYTTFKNDLQQLIRQYFELLNKKESALKEQLNP